MHINSILGFLGILKKSNSLLFGFEALKSLKTNKIHLLIVAKDISKAQQQKLETYNQSETRVLSLFTKDELSTAINRTDTIIIGVTNKKVATAILKKEDTNNDQ